MSASLSVSRLYWRCNFNIKRTTAFLLSLIKRRQRKRDDGSSFTSRCQTTTWWVKQKITVCYTTQHTKGALAGCRLSPNSLLCSRGTNHRAYGNLPNMAMAAPPPMSKLHQRNKDVLIAPRTMTLSQRNAENNVPCSHYINSIRYLTALFGRNSFATGSTKQLCIKATVLSQAVQHIRREQHGCHDFRPDGHGPHSHITFARPCVLAQQTQITQCGSIYYSSTQPQ